MKRAAKHEITPLLGDQSIGLEARMSSDDHQSLRLWLRLLACSTDIETEIRKRLRAQLRHDAAALRLPGAAAPPPRRAAHERAVALPDGHRRQRHRPDRRAGEATAWCSATPSPATGARYRVRAHRQGPQASSSRWPRSTSAGWSSCSAASAMPTRAAAVRPARPAARAAVRRATTPPQESPDPMSTDPALLAGNRRAQAGYRAEHFLWSVDGGVGHHHAEPARAQEPADLRLLRRAARPVPARCSYADDVQGGGGARRRRQLLLGRRRARDHRPADRAEGARAADVHAHDRRPGQGHARLPAADHRGDRRRVRRRRRDHRHGLRPAPAAPRAARPPSCSTASAWPAATWAPAPCCRASSARAAPPSCCTPAARWAARRASAGASSTALCAPEALLAEAQALAQRAGRRPDLRPRHHQDHAAPGMGHGRRPGDRGRGAGAGDLHADRGLPPRLPRLRRQAASRCSKATEHGPT